MGYDDAQIAEGLVYGWTLYIKWLIIKIIPSNKRFKGKIYKIMAWWFSSYEFMVASWKLIYYVVLK